MAMWPMPKGVTASAHASLNAPARILFHSNASRCAGEYRSLTLVAPQNQEIKQAVAERGAQHHPARHDILRKRPAPAVQHIEILANDRES